METLLKDQQVARHLQVSPGTVRNWRHKGVGPPYRRIGTRAIRYDLEDLDRWTHQGENTIKDEPPRADLDAYLESQRVPAER